MPIHEKPKLYQEHPRNESLYPGLKSKTESRESFRLASLQEFGKLRANGTIPNHIVQLNYLTELTVKEIQALWRKHSRRLYKAGIVACVTIEITKDEWRQRPTNNVHYHIVVKDHTRTHDELKELFEAIYQCEMELSAFKVNVYPFDEKKGGWRGYIAYLVKLKDKNGKPILFEKGLRLRKYYTVGRWWTNKDGTRATAPEMREKVRRFAIARKRLEKSERFIPVRYQVAEWELPTDYIRLQRELDKRTDEMLYDWFSILRKQPTVFQTKPPKWLLEGIQSQPLKRNELLDALFERIQYSKNPDIVLALEIYHDYVCTISENKDNSIESDSTSYPNELIGQVKFMLDLLDDLKVEYRHYVIERVKIWVNARKRCLLSGTWVNLGARDKDFPGTVERCVDFYLYVIDSIGEDFPKEEYRHYIVDTVSEWINEV